MDATRKIQLSHLAAAKAQLCAWAESNGVPLVHLDFVIPFVKTDFDVIVWAFFETDADVTRLDRNGGSLRVQEEFLSLLGADGYPAGWLSGVAFFIDSHENVVRNYEGSYFYRLR